MNQSVVIRFERFMLPEPEPAEDVLDVEDARAALADAGAPIPWDDLRRDLGL